VIDNEASDDATVIKVDSVNSHGTLLAVVQVIADLNLVIRKAYFSSDGNWFMDGQSVPKSFFALLFLLLHRCLNLSFFHLCPSAFNVTDRDGNKVLDASTISYIQKVIDGFQNVLGS
jgi:hypothetical protein